MHYLRCSLYARLSLLYACSLFVAVIVDNLEHTQAAASASKPKSKVKHTVRLCTHLVLHTQT